MAYGLKACSCHPLRPKQNELKDTQNQYRVVADIPHSLLIGQEH